MSSEEIRPREDPPVVGTMGSGKSAFMLEWHARARQHWVPVRESADDAPIGPGNTA